jgi:hypothetical protein
MGGLTLGLISLCSVDGAQMMDQFAQAVGDMTDNQARRAGSLARDTQWRMQGRNALDKIKTVDDLNEAAEELSSQTDNVLTNMDSAIKEILFNVGWTSRDADAYCMLGLLPRLMQQSLQTFYELHVHFQKLAIAHRANWKDVGKEHVVHHSLALMRIRRFALTRNQMVLQTYTYLRDAKSKGFLDIKLLGALTIKWQSLALHPRAESSSTPTGPTLKLWDCSHCQSSSLDEGGAKKCPAKELRNKPARRAAKEALKSVKDEPGAFARLIAEELAHE